MDTRQNDFLQMCAAVKATANAHNTAWNTYPAFSTPYASFLSTLTLCDEAIALQERASEGTTEHKAKLRQKLTERIIQLAAVLMQYGVDTNNLQLRRDVYLSQSDINKLSEKAFIGHCLKVKSLIPTPLPAAISAAPAAITATFISNLQNLITDFTNAVGTPRHIQAESMRGTEALETHINTLREKLELMDIAAAVLQYSQAAFHSEYTNSRFILDSASTQRALSVQITEAETGTAIAAAQCTINPGAISKLSGDMGYFYLQSLPAGNYTIEAVKAGYRTTTYNFVMDEVGGIQVVVPMERG